MNARLASTSDGAGAPLSALIASWAKREPRIRRVWLARDAHNGSGAVSIEVELQPVGDSEETMPIWLAQAGRWRAELEARLARPIEFGFADPDRVAPLAAATTLIFERPG